MKPIDYFMALCCVITGLFLVLVIYIGITSEPSEIRQAHYIKEHKCVHTGFVGSRKDGILKVYSCDVGLKVDSEF